MTSREPPNYGSRLHRTGAEMHTRDIGSVDALGAAKAIVRAARRRHARHEKLRDIGPPLALTIGMIVVVATMAAMIAASTGIPIWCTLFGHCPDPF